MMYQRGVFALTEIPEINSHVIELPYGKEDRLSMIILLPAKRVQLVDVLDKLPAYGIQRITAALRKAEEEFEDDEVELYLPRFTINADFTLNVLLDKMGLKDIFDPNLANLSGISKQSIYLSRVIHKSVIQVNEIGTSAASASGAFFINKTTPPRFYANRPFAFLIIERTTNAMLFCGQVRHPGLVPFSEL